jgi:hypothetical protein
MRQCRIDPHYKAINPENIYNDETLKLTYGHEIEDKEERRNKVTRNFSTKIFMLFFSEKFLKKKQNFGWHQFSAANG